MLTKPDEKLIRHIVKDVVETVVEKKIKHLPTSTQFFNEMDKLYTKLERVDENRIVEAGWKDQIEDHETRIENLELRSKSVD